MLLTAAQVIELARVASPVADQATEVQTVFYRVVDGTLVRQATPPLPAFDRANAERFETARLLNKVQSMTVRVWQVPRAGCRPSAMKDQECNPVESRQVLRSPYCERTAKRFAACFWWAHERTTTRFTPSLAEERGGGGASNGVRAPRRGRPWRAAQRGAAVLMALFVAALATMIITGLFYRQFVLLRTIENQQLTSQSRLLLRGALDWESRDPARGRQSLAIRRAKRAVVAAFGRNSP